VTALALDRVMRSAGAALKERGLTWFVQPEDGPIRVFGPPGAFDPYLLTEVWAGEGFLRAECSVPVVVPTGHVGRTLELCALLNGQGRVGFALGRRGTPIATVTVQLPAALDDIAQPLCDYGFNILWHYASCAEPLFAAVAAGAEFASVLGEAATGGPAGPAEFPIQHRPSESPRGTSWPGALDGAPKPPAVPEGYTEAELQGLFAAIRHAAPSHSEMAEGIINACGGPTLIHADGVVECFGCTDPGGNPHLEKCTVSCAPGVYLGEGHLCPRCETQT